ncbi:MAG: hypothetical protein IJ783_02210, partial [Kiritimatiellae bacterium]|nr:hypothetical protein [Kiritimatiellia bacterium]
AAAAIDAPDGYLAIGDAEFDTPIPTRGKIEAINDRLEAAAAAANTNSLVVGKDARGPASEIDLQTGIELTDYAVVLGNSARGTAFGTTAVGHGAAATDHHATAVGRGATAAQSESIAIGSGVRHVDETDETGDNAYARGAQAVAIGYGAKAYGDKAVQLGTGVNTNANSFQVNGTLVVKDGRVNFPEEAVAAAATNAIVATLGNRLAVLEQPPADTNGFAYARLSSYDAAADADGGFVLAVNTNDAARTMSVQIGAGPQVEIYKCATVDALLAQKAPGTAAVNPESVNIAGMGTVTFDATNQYIRLSDMIAIGSGTIAHGSNSLAVGTRTIASGTDAVAVGTEAIAEGRGGLAQGYRAIATGEYASASGSLTSASGYASHAEGHYSTATNEAAHAEGYSTRAYGEFSHAEGNESRAYGKYSHAEGWDSRTSADAIASHAAGATASATNRYSWVWNSTYSGGRYYSHGDGTFNISPANGPAGFYIGESNLVEIVDAQIAARMAALEAALSIITNNASAP